MSSLSRRNAGSGGLVKNSQIRCTIDDLQLEDGLLVVSFSHKDNLYQGVLLQLNRERGIPAGISFPKDYFSETKELVHPTPCSVQPPVNQRDTYFQETMDNGRQCRSLRRVIKTPARFKNSRMSLRPVQRPVLCAKCGVLCNDKKDEAGGGNGSAEETDKRGKNGEKKSIITKINSKDKVQLNHAPKVTINKLSPTMDKDDKIMPVIDDPKDYNYVGVGSRGVVDNVWKRPLAKPVRANSSNWNIKNDKDKLKVLAINPASSSKAKDNPVPQLCESTIFRITKPLQVTKKKANNLKLCIKKLTIAQEERLLGSSTKEANKEDISDMKTNTESTVPIVLPGKMNIPVLSKIKLKRRNSTMPYKFREVKTGKIATTASWRTRRISTMSNPDSNFSSELLANQDNRAGNLERGGRADSPKMPELQAAVTSLSSKLEDSDAANIISTTASNAYLNHLSPKQSPEHFKETIEQIPPPVVKEPTKTKTPVIKITFGSLGKGVVVQIPPRHTNHSNESCETENDAAAGTSNHHYTKAERKAMKKAKKEAKRKHNSKESPSPPVLLMEETVVTASTSSSSSSPTKPALAPLTINLNSAHNHATTSCVSPNIPVSQARRTTGCPPLFAAIVDVPSADLSNNVNDVLVEEPSSIATCSKKHKKARKKKKDHKENDSKESDSSTITSVEPSSPINKSETSVFESSFKRKRSPSISPKSNNFGDQSEDISSECSSIKIEKRFRLSFKRIQKNTKPFAPPPRSKSWCISYSSDEVESDTSSDFIESIKTCSHPD